jgi:hypothetical protein
MNAPRKKFLVPKDEKLLGELRSAFNELPPESVDEVYNLLDQFERFGADKDDQMAIFNGRFEVICREVPGSVFVLLVRDMRQGEWTLTGVSREMPQVQAAVERCAESLGVIIEKLYIRS